MNALRVGLGVGVGSTAVMFGLVGLLHLPAFRPLLHAGSGGCPVGMDTHLTAEQVDDARNTVLSHDRGVTGAAARPALGFVLDVTSRAEVAAWAVTHGVQCDEGEFETRCGAVPTGAMAGIPKVDQLLLRFDAEGRLVVVDATIREIDAEGAAALVRTMSEDLGRTAGTPTTTRGEPSGAYLARGAMNQSRTSFRFEDYRADVTATNVGSGRIVVRATFQSVG